MNLWPTDRYFPYLAVRQGETASCYFVAMLISHLIHGRGDVRKLAYDLGAAADIKTPFAGAPLRIKKGFPMRDGEPLDRSDVDILAVLHKALAIYVLAGHPDKCIDCREEYGSGGCRCHPKMAAPRRVPKWDRLNWGYPHIAHEWFSGRVPLNQPWHGLSLRSLHAMVGQRGPTVLVSRQDLSKETWVRTDRPGHLRRLVAAHAYSVIQVGLSFDYILLRDPYGDDGDSEYVMLSEAEVREYFGYVSSGRDFRFDTTDLPVAGGPPPQLEHAESARWITPGAVIHAGSRIVRCIQIRGGELALLVGSGASDHRPLRRPGDTTSIDEGVEVTYVDLSADSPIAEVGGLRLEFHGSEVSEARRGTDLELGLAFSRALVSISDIGRRVRHEWSELGRPLLPFDD